MGTNRKNTALTVRILGRDYSIACPEDEREALLRSAEYLSQRMTAIQRQGKTLGNERIAIMAALNITHDLLALQHATDQQSPRQSRDDDETSARLAQLQLRIESALDSSGYKPDS